MLTSVFETQVLDATGLKCPLPVLRAQKLLRNMSPGAQLTLLSTDEVSQKEIPLFCEQAGYELVETDYTTEIFRFIIRKYSR
jgi:tRNA 2-thiouridine synthesizing protein A